MDEEVNARTMSLRNAPVVSVKEDENQWPFLPHLSNLLTEKYQAYGQFSIFISTVWELLYLRHVFIRYIKKAFTV